MGEEDFQDDEHTSEISPAAGAVPDSWTGSTSVSQMSEARPKIPPHCDVKEQKKTISEIMLLLDEEGRASPETYLAGTLHFVWSFLLSATGPCLFAVVPASVSADIQGEPLDGGYMDRRLGRKNVFKDTEEVRLGWRDFVAKPDPLDIGYQADRWPLSHPDVDARGRPKDGCAGLLTYNGTMLRSCFRLDHRPAQWRMQGGCRHSAALGLAEHLGSSEHGGVVFVKSETGAIRILFARVLAQSGEVYLLGR